MWYVCTLYVYLCSFSSLYQTHPCITRPPATITPSVIPMPCAYVCMSVCFLIHVHVHECHYVCVQSSYYLCLCSPRSAILPPYCCVSHRTAPITPPHLCTNQLPVYDSHSTLSYPRMYTCVCVICYFYRLSVCLCV